MAQIATCPHCVSEVYAPEASGDASVACPVCEKPFVLSAARRRPLPEAKPVAPAPPEEKLSKPPATERTPTASEMMQAFLHPKAASNELAGTLPAPKSKLASPLAPTPKPAFEMELDDLMRSVPEHDEENDQTPGGSSSDEAALAANAPSSEEGNSREPENAPPRDAVPRRTLASMLAESPRLDQQLLKASLPSRQPSSDVSHTRTDPETPAESTALVPSDKEASATPFRLPEFGLPQSDSGIASPLEMDEAPPDELMLDDNAPGVLQGGFDRPVAGYSRSRPRSRKRSATVFVTGMVVFSLAGLLMGYGVLNAVGGAAERLPRPAAALAGQCASVDCW